MALFPCLSGGGLKKTELWTNSSPTSDFGAQTISGIDVSNYDMLEIEYKAKTDSNEIGVAVFYLSALTASHSSGVYPRYTLAGVDSGAGVLARNVGVVNGGVGGVSFGAGEVGSYSDRNSYLIPTKISGVKA